MAFKSQGGQISGMKCNCQHCSNNNCRLLQELHLFISRTIQSLEKYELRGKIICLIIIVSQA